MTYLVRVTRNYADGMESEWQVECDNLGDLLLLIGHEVKQRHLATSFVFTIVPRKEVSDA